MAGYLAAVAAVSTSVSRYEPVCSNYPGGITGEMPVGIETWENKDGPRWPEIRLLYKY